MHGGFIARSFRALALVVFEPLGLSVEAKTLRKVLPGIMTLTQTFASFANSIQVANLLGLSFFTWEKGCLVYISGAVRKRIWEGAKIILLFFYISFLVYQSLLLQFQNNVEVPVDRNGLIRKTQALYVAAVWTFLCSDHYINMIHGREFVRLANGIQNFFQSAPNLTGKQCILLITKMMKEA